MTSPPGNRWNTASGATRALMAAASRAFAASTNRCTTASGMVSARVRGGAASCARTGSASTATSATSDQTRRMEPSLPGRGDLHRPASDLPLLLPGTGHGGDLPHPCRDLAFVEVLLGLELHAPRRLAHRHRRHRGNRVERRAVHEHEFDVIGEPAAAEAPAVADAIEGYAPFHGTVQ